AFFSKLKHFRRIFSRFDKTTSAFSGFLHLAGALIWMR
ncbi:TPA: IS5/IS1182 family transposase, partial [Legionella pneumophila]